MVNEVNLFPWSRMLFRTTVENGDSIRRWIGRDLHLSRLATV
jgi:hypothetical protein